MKDFNRVKTGELGGYIESENNLSHEGNAWVYDDAKIYGGAKVCDNAIVGDNAKVYNNAIIRGNAIVYGNAILGDNVIIEKDTDWFTVGPIGSRNGFITFALSKDESIYVFCGCFHDNIDEFEKAVEETHKGTKYEKEYKLAIALAKDKMTTIDIEENRKS